MSVYIGPKASLRIIVLCEQFFLDAAVLVFVFPVLDTLVNFGTKKLTVSLLLWTLAISGVFFIGAMFMAVLAAKNEAKP